MQGTERALVRVAEAIPEVPAVLERVDGVVDVSPGDGGGYQVTYAQGSDLRPELARAVVEQGWGLLELRDLGMSLEDIFLQLTTEETPGKRPVEDRARKEVGDDA